MRGKMAVCWMGAMLIALPALGRDVALSPRAHLLGQEAKVLEAREDGDVIRISDIEEVSYTPSGKSDVGVAVGEIDTVGSSTYDLQWNAAAVRRIAFDPDLGKVHLIWTWSDVADPFPDRQVYYNCYIPGTGWVFGQGMDGGTPCQTAERSGFGTIDLLSDGRAVVALHRVDPAADPADIPITTVGVDLFPGAGIFTFVDLSPEEIIWPRVSVTANDLISLSASHSGAGIDELHRAYSTDMGASWTDLLLSAASPGLGNNNFASDISDKVCMVWPMHALAEPMFNTHLYYVESVDGGQTWGRERNITEHIPLPAVGDWYEWYMTRNCFGGSGIYDNLDNLHYVFAASFGTRTGPGYFFPFLPNPLWHYSPGTGVSVVTYLSPGVLPDMPALNRYGFSYLADRPSLGQDGLGYLYCVWREFSFALWDVATGFPLGEIYAARSMDGGLTWGPKVNLTMTPTLNEVYPSLAKFVNDTLHIIYQRDYGVGLYVHAEGPRTDNPIIYHNVPVIPGDIEVVSIDAPPHWGLDTTSYIGQTYTPKVTYHNKGAETITFQARFEIESPSFFMVLNDNQDTILQREGLYYDIVEVTLEGGASVQVEFAPFFVDTSLAPPGEPFRAKLYYTGIAALLGDIDITDNTLRDSLIVGEMVGIEERPEHPPLFALKLSPNPSLGSVSIDYTVPQKGLTTIRIFDVVGRLVMGYEEDVPAGAHIHLWDGKDASGQRVPSGVYFVRLAHNGEEISKKLLLLQ